MADGRRSGPSLPDDTGRPEDQTQEHSQESDSTATAASTAGKRRRQVAGVPEDAMDLSDLSDLDTSAPIDPLKVAASGLVHETPPRRRGRPSRRSADETTQPPQDPLALLAESIDSGEAPAETPRRWFGRGRPDESAPEHDPATGTEPLELPMGADAPAEEPDEAVAPIDQPTPLDPVAPLDPRPRGTFPRRGEQESAQDDTGADAAVASEPQRDAVADDWSFDELEATQWDADTQTAHAEAPAEESDQGQAEPDEVDVKTPDPTDATADIAETDIDDTAEGANPMDLLAEYTSSAATRPRDLGWSSRHAADRDVSEDDAAEPASAPTESAADSWSYRPAARDRDLPSESAAPFESASATTPPETPLETPTETPTEMPSEAPTGAAAEAGAEPSAGTPAHGDTWSRSDDDLWPEPDRDDDDVVEEDDNVLRSWISRRLSRRQPARGQGEIVEHAGPEPSSDEAAWAESEGAAGSTEPPVEPVTETVAESEAPAAEPAPAESPAVEPEPDTDEEQATSDAGWSAADVPAVLPVEEPTTQEDEASATVEEPSAAEEQPPAAVEQPTTPAEELSVTVHDEATDAGGPPEDEQGAEETGAAAGLPEAEASAEDDEHTWTAEELAAEGWSTEDLTGAGWTTEQLAEIGWFEHLATAFGQARTEAPTSSDEALSTEVVPADREEEQGSGETADWAMPAGGAATEDVQTEKAQGEHASVDDDLTEEEHHERHGLFGRRRRRRHDEPVVDEDIEQIEQAEPGEQAAELDQAAEPVDAGTPSLDAATVLPTLTEWSDESSPEVAPAEVPVALPADEAPAPAPEDEQQTDDQPAEVEAPAAEDETAIDEAAEPPPAAETPAEETQAPAAIAEPEEETGTEADVATEDSPADQPEPTAEVAEATTMEETGPEPAQETVEDTVGDTVVQTPERATEDTDQPSEQLDEQSSDQPDDQPDEQPDEDHVPVQEPATEEASVSETEAQKRAAVPATRQPQPDDEFGLLDDFELYEDNQDFDLERPLAEQGLKPQPAAPAAAAEPEVTPAQNLVEAPPADEEAPAEAPAADAAEEAPAEETPAADEAPKTTAPWAARGRGRKRGGATPAAAATAAGTTTPATTGSESGTADSADTTTEGEEEESGEPPPAEPAPADQVDAPTPEGSEESADASGESSDADDEPEEPEAEPEGAPVTVVGTEHVEVIAAAPEPAPAAPVEDAADDADTGPPPPTDDVAPTADVTVAASSGTTTADVHEAAAAPVPDPFDQAVISEPTTEELRAWFEPAPQESAAAQPAEAAAAPAESTEVVERSTTDDVDVDVDRPEISPVSRSWLYGREATTPVPAEEFAPPLPVADPDALPGRRAARGTEPETLAPPPPPSARAPGKRARRRAAAEAVHDDDQVEAMPSQVSAAFTSAMDDSDEIPAFVEYRPTDFRRYALAVLFTITAVLAVLAIFYAVQEGSASSIITALSVTVLACAFWWGLLSWSPVIVSIARGTLEIAHGPTSQRFDLTNPDTQVSVGPNTHAREWTAEVARPGGAPVRIRASQVRPEQFSRIVAYYRRDAERRRTPRLFA